MAMPFCCFVGIGASPRHIRAHWLPARTFGSLMVQEREQRPILTDAAPKKLISTSARALTIEGQRCRRQAACQSVGLVDSWSHGPLGSLRVGWSGAIAYAAYAASASGKRQHGPLRYTSVAMICQRF